MSVQRKSRGQKIGKIIAIVFFVFLMLFNVKIYLSDDNDYQSTFSLSKLSFDINYQEAFASNEQKYKLSYGYGCPSYCSGPGWYWASCHLPSSLNECSIFPCECYGENVSGY